MKLLMNVLLQTRRLYWWLFRPKTRGVRAMVINPHGQILLVRHSYGDGWYLPGGRVKGGESDLEALRREVFEETGAELRDPIRQLGIYQNRKEYKRDTIVVFVVKNFEMKTRSDVEIQDACFFSPRDLPIGISAGTRRRIEEWMGELPSDEEW